MKNFLEKKNRTHILHIFSHKSTWNPVNSLRIENSLRKYFYYLNWKNLIPCDLLDFFCKPNGAYFFFKWTLVSPFRPQWPDERLIIPDEPSTFVFITYAYAQVNLTNKIMPSVRDVCVKSPLIQWFSLPSESWCLFLGSPLEPNDSMIKKFCPVNYLEPNVTWCLFVVKPLKPRKILWR